MYTEEKMKTREELIAEISDLRNEIVELRKEREKRENNNLKDLHDLFENANDLIQSVTPDGRFKYVNKKWRETLGYSEEEVEKLDIFDIVHPDSQEHCRDIFQRVMSGDTVDIIKANFITKDGKKIFVEGNVNCRFTKGKPTATRAIFRDMTEQKGKEAEDIIKGGSQHLKVPELIQICNFFVPGECCITVTTPEEDSGEIHIKNGKIINAKTNDVKGEKAFFKMLDWETDTYKVDKCSYKEEVSINKPVQEFLLESTRKLDEYKRLRKSLIDENKKIMVQYSDNLMKKEYDPLTAEILDLIIEYKDIDSVLEKCSCSDFEAMSIIEKLLSEKIIETKK
jgi:PAS domain S-box-containing protein